MLDENVALTNGKNTSSAAVPTDEELWGILEDESVEGSPDTLNHSQSNSGTLPVGSMTEQSIGADEEGDFSEFEEDSEPDSFRTRVSFASNPVARLGLAAGGVLVLVVAVGAVVGGLQSSTTPPVAQVTPPPTPSPFASPMVPGSEGSTKEQLAFQEQKERMKNQKLPPPVMKKTTVAKQITPTPTISPSPTPIPESTPPPPVPIPPPPAPIPPATQPSPPIAVTTIPIDPNKEWADLAQAGTYGSFPATVLASSSNTPLLSPPIVSSPPLRPPDTLASSSLPSSTLGLPSLSTYASSHSGSKKLRIGSTATATLINPIAWSPDGKDAAFGNSSKFIVRLEEPLKGADGEVVIPSGAELVVAVRSLDPKTGLADLTALQVIINNQEYAPPAGSITVRGESGRPLMADKLQDKGREIAAGDMSLILFGALSKVGEVMNQPSSATSVATGTTTVSSVSNSPNILGSALQGGFSVLAQQQQQRNQQWISEITSRPDVRFIPSGRRLQIFVNQSITL